MGHNQTNQATAPGKPSCTAHLGAVLERAITFAANAGFERAADNLRDLLVRVREQRFHLAVLGQFKRGKSTLLNARRTCFPHRSCRSQQFRHFSEPVTTDEPE